MPLFAGTPPGDFSLFVVIAFRLDGIRLIHACFRSIGEEDVGSLASEIRTLSIDKIVRPQEPQAADEPVVGQPVGALAFAVHIDVLGHEIVEFAIFAEQPPELLVFVRASEFLSRIPAYGPEQLGFTPVVASSLDEEIDAFFDPLVTESVVVLLDGNVVRQVMGLKFPDRHEVGLQFRHLVHGGDESFPVLGAFVFVGFGPQDICGHTAHTERRQTHGFAGRIDLAEFRLREVVFPPQLRENAAGPGIGRLAGITHSRSADHVQRIPKQRDPAQVEDLAPKRDVLDHAATSRVFRKKYPTIETTTRYARPRSRFMPIRPGSML